MAKKRDNLVHQYAAAAFEAALESWQKPLAHVLEALHDQPDTLQGLVDHRVPLEQRQGTLERLLPPEAPRPLRNFLFLLLEEEMLGELGAILQEFATLASAREEAGAVAEVTTATSLNEEDQAALEDRLRARFGANLRFLYRQDPILIGGVRVQVGDVVIDGSLSARLQQIREQLTAGNPGAPGQHP